jgi:predicted nucleotide-binding protein (sugar kinase/HSP70/actin superfamily)
MKVTFPHMGHTYIPIKALLEKVGLEVIIPPISSKKTLSLGVQHSPEYACLPLKINMGNFIEARELGADTIVMAGGAGPCRFGYYAQIQREILHDLGLDFEVIVLEPPDTHYTELANKISTLADSWWKVISGMRLAYYKACAIDSMEKKVQQVRARERQKGSSDKIFAAAINLIDKSAAKKEIKEIAAQAALQLNQVEKDPARQIIKVAIVGEIYTVLEPFVNFDIEKKLGSLGVEVTRSIYLSQWINDHLFLGMLPGDSSKKILKLSKPYLNSFVGGHGRETIASTVSYAQQGYDGVIQLAPFTCMPEIVAHSVMPVVSKEHGIPVMTIYLDEQSGEAGIKTRVEAFVDLLRRKKEGGIKSEMLFGH